MKGFNYSISANGATGKYQGKTQHLQLAKNVGAEVCCLWVDGWAWEHDVVLANGKRYREHAQEIANVIKAQGFYFILLQGTYEKYLSYEERATIINNDRYATAYIALNMEMIAALQPNGVKLFPELKSGVTWERYKQFCDLSIKRYEETKGDIDIFVLSLPFYDLSAFHQDPFPNAFYVYHLYTGMKGQEADYNLWRSNPTQAYQNFKNKWISGAKPLLEKGFKLFCGECGGVGMYFVKEWHKLHYDLMKENNVGYTIMNLACCGSKTDPNNFRILATDTTFNEVGEAWVQSLADGGHAGFLFLLLILFVLFVLPVIGSSPSLKGLT